MKSTDRVAAHLVNLVAKELFRFQSKKSNLVLHDVRNEICALKIIVKTRHMDLSIDQHSIP